MPHGHASRAMPCLTAKPHCHSSLPCLTAMPHCHASLPCLTVMPHCHASRPCLTAMPHCHASRPCLTRLTATLSCRSAVTVERHTLEHHPRRGLLAASHASTVRYRGGYVWVQHQRAMPLQCGRPWVWDNNRRGSSQPKYYPISIGCLRLTEFYQ